MEAEWGIGRGAGWSVGGAWSNAKEGEWYYGGSGKNWGGEGDRGLLNRRGHVHGRLVIGGYGGGCSMVRYRG